MTERETLEKILEICRTYDRITFAILDIEDLASEALGRKE